MFIFNLSIFLVSITLLIINILGLKYKNRVPNIPEAKIKASIFGQSKKIENERLLNPYPLKDEKIVVNRLMSLISDHMIHYLPPDHDRIPLTINWLLTFLSFTGVNYFKFYEFYNGYRAIKKEYGLCSQIAVTIWYFLRKATIKNKVIRFKGHVLNLVEFSNGEIWVVDGDYRVIMPYDLLTLCKYSEKLVNQYYHDFSVEQKNRLIEIYKGKVEIISGFNMNSRLYFENFIFLVKWLIPIGFIAYSLNNILSFIHP